MGDLLLLCWELFKTGLFAVGGGMATIPFLTRIAQQHPGWFTVADLADMIAIGEATPGPIGINMATYAGFHVYGVLGGVLATLALTLPSFLIILIICPFLQKFRENRLVDASFRALRPTVTGLIAAAGFSVMQIALFGGGTLHIGPGILFLALLCATQIKKLNKIHPAAYIGVAAIAGIVFQF